MKKTGFLTEKHTVHSKFWPADCELILQKTRKSTRVKKIRGNAEANKKCWLVLEKKGKVYFKNDILFVKSTIIFSFKSYIQSVSLNLWPKSVVSLLLERHQM